MKHFLLKNFCLFLFCTGLLFTISCETKKETKLIADNRVLDYSIDTTGIPKDTVDFSNPNVSLINGLYYLNEEKFSGILFQELKGYKIKTYSSVLNGMLHGEYKSYHENGNIYEIRNYKNNASLGRQLGYWKDTKALKFDYNYFNNQKEGQQSDWYSNGNLASVYNYKNDRQDGLQQAWRLNGSLYRNFEVKNGIRYGLQKSKTCYELKDGQFQ